jgi:hypothetical protein
MYTLSESPLDAWVNPLEMEGKRQAPVCRSFFCVV